MKTNSPQLWDDFWKKRVSKKEDIYTLLKEEYSIRWQKIEKKVLQEFGSFNGLNVIEIGAGLGTISTLMAKRHANVTILDYSTNAIKRSKEFFKHNNFNAQFIKQDALYLPKNLFNKYDISMSFGLSEHFIGPNRIKINKAHFDLIRKDGIVFIDVPNIINFPYRLFKFAAEKANKWRFGNEIPYSRQEFIYFCKLMKIKEYSFFGGSLMNSFEWINPIKIVKDLYKKEKKLDFSKIKKEKGLLFDNYFSRTFVFCAKKN